MQERCARARASQGAPLLRASEDRTVFWTRRNRPNLVDLGPQLLLVASELAQSGAKFANFGPSPAQRPNLGRGPKLDAGPMLVDIGPIAVEVGPDVAIPGHDWPKLVEVAPTWVGVRRKHMLKLRS